MPVEPNPVKALFLAALDKNTAAERAAFLDDACGGDEDLRQRVEALLHAHGEPDQLLDRPAIALVAAPEAATQALGTSSDKSVVALAPNYSALDQTQPRSHGDGSEADDALALLTPSQEANSLGRLHHYEVLSVVGHGGMGTVFKARDRSLERVVAIKMLAPALAACGTARKRFEREARAAAAVTHEHVVDIHAVESAGPAPYLVMEFVGGITLEDRIQQGGPLELKELLRIGMQTAKGLAAAHAQGLVHRDVKPSNILLENGVQRVKITDFGLARAVDDASLTKSGVIAGTPLYMSPEQARGEALDHRADLFSLGSVLYTLCTGHPPFRANNTVAVLMRVCEDTPRPIREINPEIPDWLVAIVGKLMAKDPAQRFQSAAEVAELLSQHLAHLQQPQVMPRPATVTVAERAPRRRRRAPLVTAAALSAAALLLAAAGAGVAYRVLHTAAPAPPGPGVDPGDKPRPLTAEERAKLPSPFDGRKREDIPAALLTLAGGDDPDLAPAELVAVLGERRKFILPAEGMRSLMHRSDDGKMLAVACGNNVFLFDARTGELLRTLFGHTGRVINVNFSHDGKRLVSGGGDNTARVRDVASGQAAAVFRGHNDLLVALAFSPDDKRVVSAGHETVARVWDAESGKELLSLEGHTGTLHGVAFSPDGKRILTGSDDNTARVWDAETGKEIRCLKGHSYRVVTIAYSPDGKLLATGSDRELILWDADTLERLKTLPTPAGWLAFAPDGRTVLAANHETGGAVHRFTRWDIAVGKELASFPLQSQDRFGLYALSADGKTLFATRDAPDVPYVRTYDTATGKEPPLQGHKGRILGVAVSPDGKLLASGGDDRIVRIWHLAQWKAGEPLPPVRTLEGHIEFVRGMAFSPNGKFLATASHDQTISLWDVDSGQEVRSLTGASYNMLRLEFSPDGKTLAAGCQDGGVRLWNLADDKDKEGALLCKHPNAVRCVAYSPDGQWLASAGEDRQVWVSDVATGRRLQRFVLTGMVNNVAFSLDGKTLAAVCDLPDSAVHLWNVADWKETQLPGHTSHVQSVEFSPVAPLLATSALDGTVRLWDLTTTPPRTLVISPGAFGNFAWDAAFTPDGGYLVTANDNSTISVLKVPLPPKPYDPGPPRKLPEPLELAKRFSPADTLKRENIPAELLAKAGGGDPQKAPPELVAALWSKDGHNFPVRSVAISPDGKTLAAINLKTIELWNLTDGSLRHTCIGHTGDIFALAFSPNGKLLASACYDDLTVRLWDAATGEALGPLHGPRLHYSWGVAFSPDSRLLVSCSHEKDGTLQIWDVAARRLVRELRGHTSAAARVAFSPDGKLVASSGAHDQRALLWDVATGWQVGEFRYPEPNNRVHDVAFSPDGLFLTVESDLKTELFDLKTRQRRFAFPPGLNAAWRADGKLLASGLRLADIGVDPPRSTTLRVPPLATQFPKVAFTPEGRYLATANPDGTVYVLRLAERGEVYEIPPDPVELQPKTVLSAHDSAVTWTAFSTDGKSVVSAGKDGVLKLWNVAEGKERCHITAHDGGVRVLAITADGKTLATAGFDGVIRLWDADGKQLHELPGHKGGVAPLLFTANGEQLLSGGADGCVRFWDVKEGKEVKKIDASKDWITHLSLTPDGKTLATSGNDGMVRLWNVETAKERTALPERSSACFTPDGKRLAVVTPEHQIKLLDAETLEMRAVLSGHTDKPDCLQFSADGTVLASCGADGSIRVWDASHGHLLAVLRGHKGRVWSVALSADGKTLAAGDEDGKLLLWDVSGLSSKPRR